ncbi:ATP-grasp domain-containing protein [Streptomyces sp. NPDC051214]|uniref:ATP-grasp domain-containing protein n=1 Tax=Streptomyces sp. NPDC051214 TaxID=3155282 RepID=UPI003449074D
MPESTGAFVQIGATRDGLDAYRACAHRRGLPTVLVDTPAYLKWRRLLGRPFFDIEIPVPAPQCPDQVVAAVTGAGIEPVLVLAGFDHYTASAFEVATRLGAAPRRQGRAGFAPSDKAWQRTVLARHAPQTLQPAHIHLGPNTVTKPQQAAGNLPVAVERLNALAYPQVVKPVDGGGSLGVYLVRSQTEREAALRKAAATANFGGAAFSGFLVEEHVSGTEYSLQCLAWEGKAHVLSFCEKVVLPECNGTLEGFREVGHIAAPGDQAPAELKVMAQACLDATGFEEGPFHVDLIRNHEGAAFLEMGFRLSGLGLVAVVEQATGINWAELAFAAHLDHRPPDLKPGENHARTIGQLIATHPTQLTRANDLAARRPGIRIHRAPSAPDTQLFSPADLRTLAPDRERHAVILGKVIITAEDAADVRQQLIHCAAAGHS